MVLGVIYLKTNCEIEQHGLNVFQLVQQVAWRYFCLVRFAVVSETTYLKTESGYYMNYWSLANTYNRDIHVLRGIFYKL